MYNLQTVIEQLYEDKIEYNEHEFEKIFKYFINELNAGNIRTAEPVKSGWKVNGWIKKGILLGFKYGRLIEFSNNDFLKYFDKHTYPLRPVNVDSNVRIVPGGTSIRSGSYVAPGVVIMPPAYINAGAYVDSDTMIDSHALVGSCAQIGKRVHISAAAQIGGVLEPIGALPVIIENDVLIGGNSGIYDGTIVKKNAVIGAGTILTASIPVYDLVNETVLKGSQDKPLIIPENAVVVQGSRAVKNSEFSMKYNLSVSCAIIVKYRDEKTDLATTLEELLR